MIKDKNSLVDIDLSIAIAATWLVRTSYITKTIMQVHIILHFLIFPK